MVLKFSNVVPEPLKEQQLDSQIWHSSVEFNGGKRYLVTAPSGKGKSTFLHILFGLRNDFSGTFDCNGTEGSALSLSEWAKIRRDELSIVYQDLRLLPDRTALENIQLNNQLHNFCSEQEIEEMANRLGVASLLPVQAVKLSYGQRQRIAIIRSLCQPAKLLLLDEPFSHLDEENTHLAMELIEEKCAEQNCGWILVSLGEAYTNNFDQKLNL